MSGDPTTSPAKTGTGPPRDELEVYAADLFVREDPLLVELRAELEARGFPLIQVPARTGLILSLLVRTLDARRILEVGTLGGYSALWMARAMSTDGELLSLEKDPGHAEMAREFVARAGLSDAVSVWVGDATDLLPDIGPDGSFDLIFLDADKESYATYLEHARRLLRPGGLLLADNAFWRGRVLQDPDEADEATRALQAFNRTLAGHSDFDATIIPAGDGVAMAVRR